MELYERIKMIRKENGLTQAEFGKMIGLSRDNVANIEGNRMAIKEIHIMSICDKFKVNEDWLRTGTGVPYVDLSKEELIAQKFGELMMNGQDTFKKRFISELLLMDDDLWEPIYKIMKKMVDGDLE